MSNEPSEPLIYIPKNAKINEENIAMDVPEVLYEDRKVILDLEKVKKVVKGQYGRSTSSQN